MMQGVPLYESQYVPGKLADSGNNGLWWNKFFRFYEDDFSCITSAISRRGEETPDGKVLWIQTLEGTRGQKQIISDFALRQFALGTAQGAAQKVFATNWHFATGLGYSHPVENGFCWHHTLGLPYLPASGIKGLLRAWIEQWEEFADDGERKTVLLSWFGNENGEATHEDLRAGDLIFFDAIPLEPVKLTADVMTPHMGKWYAEGDGIRSTDGSGRGDAARIPSDWHAPVPVPFLAVESASLLFQIAARRKSTLPEDYGLDKAMALLQAALEHLGIGAKTAAGYGRMSEDAEALGKLTKKQEDAHEKHLRTAKQEAKKQAAAAISETEETVTMIAEPNIASETVTVKTESGEEFLCVKVPAFRKSVNSLSRWQSDDEDDHKIEAKVTRENGVITKVIFVDWF